jgi:hypothetical protein
MNWPVVTHLDQQGVAIVDLPPSLGYLPAAGRFFREP